MKINIAIDGPSGSGKSSVSKILAKKLNYTHIDTGAMYRSVAYMALKNNVDLKDEDKLALMIKDLKLSFDENNEITVNDENINAHIRTDEISMLASDISTFAKVRELLVCKQQEMAEEKGFVMDGRDIGTVVLKDAEVKIFLTASSSVRALRRLLQNRQLGMESDFTKLKKEIEDRDYQDIHRKTSPLRQAEDAFYIDASDLTIEEVVDKIYQIIERRLKND